MLPAAPVMVTVTGFFMSFSGERSGMVAENAAIQQPGARPETGTRSEYCARTMARKQFQKSACMY
jgi:hypothetical protein